MEKVIVLIDGSNLYHKFKDPELNLQNTSKYDYRGLINWLLGKSRKCTKCIYYVGTVKAPKSDAKGQDMRKKQQKLFNHLMSKDQNFAIEQGFLMNNNGRYHEKGVDVKMAVDLLVGAYEDKYDTALLISSDTDLIPAIRKVKELKKRIEYIGFAHQPSLGLQKYATISRLLTKDEIDKFANSDLFSK